MLLVCVFAILFIVILECTLSAYEKLLQNSMPCYADSSLIQILFTVSLIASSSLVLDFMSCRFVQ